MLVGVCVCVSTLIAVVQLGKGLFEFLGASVVVRADNLEGPDIGGCVIRPLPGAPWSDPPNIRLH